MRDVDTGGHDAGAMVVVRKRKRPIRLSGFGMFVAVVLGAVMVLGALRAVHTVAEFGIPTPEGVPVGPVAIATQTAAARVTPTTEPRLTPTPSLVDIPDPSSCRVEPRTIDGMLGLVAPQTSPRTQTDSMTAGATPSTITAAAMTPTAVISARPMPTSISVGSTAISAASAQVQRTVREIVACGNAGELLQVWAYFTDAFVVHAAEQQQAFFNRTILTARVRSLAPRSDPMPRITSIQVLSDGRVSATVAIPPTSPLATVSGLTGTATFVFVRVDGRWLIDEARSGDGTGGP